jgi:hypothetical protein
MKIVTITINREIGTRTDIPSKRAPVKEVEPLAWKIPPRFGSVSTPGEVP